MTLFRQAFRKVNLQRLAAPTKRNMSGSIVPSGVLSGWYQTFGRSTATYTTWLVMLIVVGEYASGVVTDSLWQMNNKGNTFTTYDWSKFDNFGEDDDDDDDDDEDDDDEDDE